MARGNAYCHAIMRMNGVNTEPHEDKAQLRRMIDEI